MEHKEVKGRWKRLLDEMGRGRLLLLLLIPLMVLVLCQYIVFQSMTEALLWLAGHPLPTALTWLALLLVCVAVVGLSDRLLAGALVIFVPCILLAMASQLKQAVNGIPLLVSDLALAGQAAEIAQFAAADSASATPTALAMLLGSLLLMAACRLSRPGQPTPWRRRLIRFGGSGLALALLLVFPGTTALLTGEEGEDQAGRNDRLGLLGGLYSGAFAAGSSAPGEYSQDAMNAIYLELREEGEEIPPSGVTPNVILVVSESFIDLTRLPAVEWSADPVPNFHALASEFPAGTFLSNTYAGGTGNVEMEILTGIPSAFLKEGESLTSLTGEGVYERIPSVARAFAKGGYKTAFVHAYNDALYGRSANMPAVGFDTVLFQEDFTVEKRYDGGEYISDDAMTDQIIALLEETEEPLFLHALSMDNHQPYHGEKYDTPSPVTGTSDRLDGEMLTALDCLTHGIHRADAALGRLTEYLEGTDEPTIVVFLGDHLPGMYLGTDRSMYVELGYVDVADTAQWSAETMLQMHSTDFLVWNNYGGELEVPRTVSCTALGSMMLDWAGVSKPLWFTYVDKAMEEMLLYRSRLYVSSDGSAYAAPPEADSAAVEEFRTVVYDLLYGEGYIAPKLTE